MIHCVERDQSPGPQHVTVHCWFLEVFQGTLVLVYVFVTIMFTLENTRREFTKSIAAKERAYCQMIGHR